MFWREVCDGIMVFQNDGRFTGFIGARHGHPERRRHLLAQATREQRERSGLLLPTAYENLDIDKGILYGCIRTAWCQALTVYQAAESERRGRYPSPASRGR